MPSVHTGLDSLPVELIAEILSELDLKSLIVASCLSSRLRRIIYDPYLNPWRRPILRNLCQRDEEYEDCLCNLACLPMFPRHNWIEILSIARPDFILLEATLPKLRESDWEESFRRRFLPGWWKGKSLKWRATFLKFVE